MNKYCKIYKNQKEILFVTDEVSEVQYIKELIYINKFNDNNKKDPEILLLKSNFCNLLEKNIITPILLQYFNNFEHIIIDLNFCINIQILSQVLKTYTNISTYYPLISNDFNLIYENVICNKNISYKLTEIITIDNIKKNYMYYYYINTIPISVTDDINLNIYNNYFKIYNIKSIDFRDGLTSLEKEVLNYIFLNNIQETTCIQIYHAISNKFHSSITNMLIKKIRLFVENFSYNNIINIFVPKTYILLNSTSITVNNILLNILYFDNTYIELKQDIFYFSIIPLIYYSSRTFYKYKLYDYINICIEYLKTKKIFDLSNIPLEDSNKNVKIIKEKKRIKIISLYENNILYNLLPKTNHYSALKKFKSLDPNVKLINNKYVFSKQIDKKYYIRYNNLAYKIIYKNTSLTLLHLTNKCKFYTIEHLLKTTSFLSFIITIKFIEYLNKKNLLSYRNLIFDFLNTKYNTGSYFNDGLIFPYDKFYLEDNLDKIFINYKMQHNDDLILLYDYIINNINISYDNFWKLIEEYCIEFQVYYLKKLLLYMEI